MTKSDTRRGVQSVERAFELLETLGSLGGEAGVGELAAAVELPSPTVHRILRTLSDRGYVMQMSSRRYSVGPGLIRLGEMATRRLSSWAIPALFQLEKATQETANMAILDGDMATYVAQVPSKHQMRMFTEVGRHVYPHSTGVGKALLAQLPDSKVLEIVRRTGMPVYTPTTISSEKALLMNLEKIRQRGFAIDEGEQELGVRCFAIPISGLDLPAALSISGPETRVTLASATQIVLSLREAAETLRTAMHSENASNGRSR